MTEPREFRCCMCPNRETPHNTVCPPGGPQHKEETECAFVKRYKDERGWQYFVRSGISGGNFKGCFLKPGKTSPHCMKVLPWRDSFDEAQTDLNKYAARKGWKEAHT